MSDLWERWNNFWGGGTGGIYALIIITFVAIWVGAICMSTPQESLCSKFEPEEQAACEADEEREQLRDLRDR